MAHIVDLKTGADGSGEKVLLAFGVETEGQVVCNISESSERLEYARLLRFILD